MSIPIPHVISGISIILLVIYGVDVMTVKASGDGFLPLDAMTRGIAFGFPPIVLSVIAFFTSKRPPYKGLGIMLIVTGILIIIGGIISVTSATDTKNPPRMIGEGGSLIAIGVIISVLGAIKIKKSRLSVS